MSSPYILFYSTGCNNSTAVIDKIAKAGLKNVVQYYCIDGNAVPRYITHVPTLRIKSNTETFVLVGQEIDSWITMKQPQVKKKEVQHVQTPQEQVKKAIVEKFTPAPPAPETEFESFNDKWGAHELDDNTGGYDSHSIDSNFVGQSADVMRPVSTSKMNNNDFDERMRAMEAARESI